MHFEAPGVSSPLMQEPSNSQTSAAVSGETETTMGEPGPTTLRLDLPWALPLPGQRWLEMAQPKPGGQCQGEPGCKSCNLVSISDRARGSSRLDRMGSGCR